MWANYCSQLLISTEVKLFKNSIITTNEVAMQMLWTKQKLHIFLYNNTEMQLVAWRLEKSLRKYKKKISIFRNVCTLFCFLEFIIYSTYPNKTTSMVIKDRKHHEAGIIVKADLWSKCSVKGWSIWAIKADSLGINTVPTTLEAEIIS